MIDIPLCIIIGLLIIHIISTIGTGRIKEEGKYKRLRTPLFWVSTILSLIIAMTLVDRIVKISELEEKIDTLEDGAITSRYSEMATLNRYGLKGEAATSGAFTEEYKNLFTIMRKCLDSEKPIPRFTEIDDIDGLLKEAVEQFPDFPFSYYFLGVFYKNRDPLTSQNYFKKALNILMRTSQIPGHKEDHHIFLKELLGQNTD